MKSIEFTIDGMDFASSTLDASHRAAVEDIARCLLNGAEGVPRLNDVQRIVITGYSAGTKNLELHANRRAASVSESLESCLRNMGARPAHLAKISIGDPVTKLVATAAQSSAKDRKVVIAIFSAFSPALGRPTGLDLVFVTQGDERPVLDNWDDTFNPIGPHTNTELWQLRARDLPKVFDGVVLNDHGTYPRSRTVAGDPNVRVESVSDITDATNVIDRLDPDVPLRNVFFLGHGSLTTGFLFSGRPGGPGILDSMIADDDSQTLMLSQRNAEDDSFIDDNKRFLRTLAGRLATDYAGIWFPACFVALSELHNATATVLSQEGLRNFFVGAWTNFYQVLASGIRRGTTPVRHTIDGRQFLVSVPRLHRFSHWSDRILDGLDHTRVLIRSSGRNSIPRFESLSSRGPFIPDFLHPRA